MATAANPFNVESVRITSAVYEWATGNRFVTKGHSIRVAHAIARPCRETSRAFDMIAAAKSDAARAQRLVGDKSLHGPYIIVLRSTLHANRLIIDNISCAQ